MNMDNTIKSLLYRYDCVIVPDFGGFVAKRKSAIFHPMNYRFDPPKKVVGFNSDLVHTDGLLANEMAKQYDISYQDAIVAIEKQVAEWKNLLENNQTIEIPALGTFVNNNHITEFQPAEDQNFAFESFGLTSLRGKYILRKSTDTSTTASKSNPWVSYAAAIGFALLVGGSSFFANQNLVQNQLSSVLPLLSSNTKVEKVVETPVAPVIEVNTIENTTTESSDVAHVENTATPSVNAEESSAETSTIAKEEIDLSVKKYQVIGGSFKVYSRAMEHQAKLKREGYECAIIIGKVGNYFMVAYDTFNDVNEAANYKRELEKQGKDVFMRP